MRNLESTNPQLVALVRSLKKKSKENNAPIWLEVAERLSSSRRSRIAVNLSLLNRHTKAKDNVVIPGKVLGSGDLEHAISVAAFAFSDRARMKISSAKGKCLSILDLVEANPKGSGVRVLE